MISSRIQGLEAPVVLGFTRNLRPCLPSLKISAAAKLLPRRGFTESATGNTNPPFWAAARCCMSCISAVDTPLKCANSYCEQPPEQPGAP
jgi:hypothetical protein